MQGDELLTDGRKNRQSRDCSEEDCLPHSTVELHLGVEERKGGRERRGQRTHNVHP